MERYNTRRMMHANNAIIKLWGSHKLFYYFFQFLITELVFRMPKQKHFDAKLYDKFEKNSHKHPILDDHFPRIKRNTFVVFEFS